MNREDLRRDCEHLQQIAASHGVTATLEQCEKAWESNSEDACAGWLIIYKDGPHRNDENVWKEFEPYLQDELLVDSLKSTA